MDVVDLAELRLRIPQPNSQPGGVLGMEDIPATPIPGLAFFPGGSGMWAEEGEAASWTCRTGLCMVLGNDFGRVSDFDDAKTSGEKRTIDTWRNLIHIMNLANIDPRMCFFTNAVMGLRKGTKIEGRSPGYEHLAFRDACIAFLAEQIRVVKPRAIAVLGWEPMEVLAHLSNEAKKVANCGSLSGKGENSVDKHNLGLQQASVGIDAHSVLLGALMHPVARPVNVKRRRFGGKTGIEAQAEILRRCWLAAAVH